MDYKEKYEQALDNLKKIKAANKENKELVDFIDDKYPELKESEDEKIRKSILELVKQSSHILNPMNQKSMLAWLEKQGHDGKMWIYRDVYLKEKEQLVQDGIDDVLQHPQKYGLEKQGNRKSVDKAEPKFKVGDWVVYCNEDVDLITGVEETGYIINKGSGYIPFVCEGEMRLWTIEDAKDGDVLADGDLPFIFKKTDAYNYTYAYCGISLSGNFRIDSDGEFGEWTWMLDIKPATKEQRDRLFQRMKEAGYEWDAEKKELKKIEHKFAWSEEDEKERKRVVGLLEGWLSTFRGTCYAEDCKCGIAWLKTLYS